MIRRTADGAFALDLGTSSSTPRAARSISQSSWSVRAAAGPGTHRPGDRRRGRRYADIAASVQLVLEEMLVDLARALQRETGARGPVPGRRSGAERLRQRAHPARVGLRAPVRAPGAGRRRLRAGRGALRRPHPLRQAGPRRCPTIRSGARRSRRRAGRAGRRRTGWRWRALARRDLDRAAARGPGRRAHRGLDGGASELGPRALGHRSILAAPHAAETRDRLNRDIKYREEFRPFAPAVPVERGGALLRAARRAARGWARFMSGSSRCGPSGARGWRR